MTIAGDQPAGLEDLLAAAFTAADSVLVPGAAVYVAHPAGPQAAIFMSSFASAGWEARQGLVWVKDSIVLGHGDYHYRHEPILYGYEGQVGLVYDPLDGFIRPGGREQRHCLIQVLRSLLLPDTENLRDLGDVEAFVEVQRDHELQPLG